MNKKRVFLNDISCDSPFAGLFTVPPVDVNLVSRGFAPPLVCSGSVLIWSRGLFDCLVDAGIEEHEVVDVEGSELDLLLFALSCENRPGGFSWEERERLFFFCRDRGLLPEAERIMALVEPGKRDFSHVETFSVLPASLRAMVSEGLTDIKTASAVSSLPDSVVGLVRFYPGRLSFSERRQILLWFKECFIREGWDEEEAIKNMAALLADSNPFEAARRLRFPMLTDMQERFYELRQRIVGKGGVSLQPPAFFEGGSFSVSFKFESKKQLAKKIEVLRRIEENADELFSFLG